MFSQACSDPILLSEDSMVVLLGRSDVLLCLLLETVLQSRMSPWTMICPGLGLGYM